jgi:hypothetical protein
MGNGWGRHGAGRHEMRTSNLDRLTPATAEHLLDGGERPADLRQLLAAAAGPGTARELAGEAAAVAAFVDAQRASSLPSAESRRPSMLSTALSKILAAKAVAAVVLVAGATGGVALAATASGSDDAPPADRPAATRTATPPAAGENGSENRAESAEATATESADASSAVPAPPAEPDPSMTGLCNAWAAGATDNPGKAAENPAFGALVDAAGSPEAVDGYCDDLADDAPGANRSENATRPTEAPGNPDHPTGQPTAAPGNPDHQVGPSADSPRQNETEKANSSSSGGSDAADDDSDG